MITGINPIISIKQKNAKAKNSGDSGGIRQANIIKTINALNALSITNTHPFPLQKMFLGLFILYYIFIYISTQTK